jgi:hypothetical protein
MEVLSYRLKMAGVNLCEVSILLTTESLAERGEQ